MVPSPQARVKITDEANTLRSSCRVSLPLLRPQSTREDLLSWLQAEDRNGVYLDADVDAEFGDGWRLSEADAWHHVAEVLADN